MIEIKEVTKSYNSDKNIVKALDKINLNIKKGEIVALIGPSGCGKTTLLKIISGLIKKDSGELSINKGETSYMFQKPVLLKWRTVNENILLPFEIKKKKKDTKEIIKLVGLEGFENSYPKELSGGMKQRTALARALITKPKVLLMDEPFGALDEMKRNELNLELLRIQKKLNTTILIVTHSITEAIFLADKVAIMSKRPGKIKDVIDIKLEKRNLSTKETSEFQRYVRCIRQKIN